MPWLCLVNGFRKENYKTTRREKIKQNWCHEPNILNKGNWIVSQTKHTFEHIVSNYFQFLRSIQIWPMAQAEDTTNMFIQLVDHSLHFFSFFFKFLFRLNVPSVCASGAVRKRKKWRKVETSFVELLYYSNYICAYNFTKTQLISPIEFSIQKNLVNEQHTQKNKLDTGE